MIAPAASDSPEALLAGWVAGLDWADLPASVQDRVGDLLLDGLASGFAGRSVDLLERVVRVADAFGGPGAAPVIGGGLSSPAGACLQNAYAITAATICDVYRPGLCHVSPVVIPPLLSLVGRPGITAEDLLAALAAGFEVTVRLSRELGDEHFRGGGWHAPGVVGAVGAAAAAARLLRLDAGATSNAIAYGAAQAAGTFAGLGTEAVKFNQARGALSGLLAGLIAAEGNAASSEWLTRPGSGMSAVQGDGIERGELTAGLGSTWLLHEISLRRWPAASSVQSLVECVLELVESKNIELAEIEQLTIGLSPGAYLVSGRHEWGDSLSAQQSAAWVAAATLADRTWWLEQSSPTRTSDAGLGDFARERVEVHADPALRSAAVEVAARLRNGTTVGLARTDAPGDPTRPLERREIEAKLRRTAGPHLAGDAIEDLLRLLESPGNGAFSAELTRLVSGNQRPLES